MKILGLLILLSLAHPGHSASNPQVLNLFTTQVQIETDTSTSEFLTVIPEPSTYALLVLSALAIAGYNVRNRRRKKS
jgi:hypothetical protein